MRLVKGRIFYYRPFHKTLPRSSASLNWISVRFYVTDCIWILLHIISLLFALFLSIYCLFFIEQTWENYPKPLFNCIGGVELFLRSFSVSSIDMANNFSNCISLLWTEVIIVIGYNLVRILHNFMENISVNKMHFIQ